MGLKNLFLKDEPKSEQPKVESKGAPVSAPVAPQMFTNMSNMTVVADEKFIAMLMEVIKQNNEPGQDYYEFKQTIDAMKALPIDERTKFITAFTTFNLQGCTKQTLIDSIGKYINYVLQEKESFNKELESQRNATVTSKASQIEEARKKLESLNKEITELNNFILTTSQEVQNAEMKLQMTNSNFQKSVEVVVNLLNSDKDKINSYIQ